MSYGKSPLTSNQIQQMQTHQGNMSQMSGRATKKGKGGGSSNPNKRHFSNAYKPNELSADIIRLIPDECIAIRLDDNDQPYKLDTTWKEFKEHFHAAARDSIVCSGGPYALAGKKFAHLREDCWGCYERYRDFDAYKAEGKKPPISHSQQYSFIVLLTGIFHQVSVTNARGKKFDEWQKCVGTGCPYCGTQCNTKWGHVKPWPMYGNIFDSLLTYAKHIENGCISCGNRSSIQHMSWYCPHCGVVAFDQTTTATPEQLNEVVNSVYACPHCQQQGFLLEQINCACGNPKRASLFDVDLTVQLSNKNFTCLGWSDPAPINPAYDEALKYKPKLENKFAPTDLGEQVKRFKPQQQVQQMQPNAQGAPQMPGQFPNTQAYVQEYSDPQMPAPQQQQQQQQQPAYQQPAYQQPAQQYQPEPLQPMQQPQPQPQQMQPMQQAPVQIQPGQQLPQLQAQTQYQPQPEQQLALPPGPPAPQGFTPNQ